MTLTYTAVEFAIASVPLNQSLDKQGLQEWLFVNSILRYLLTRYASQNLEAFLWSK